MSLQFYPQLPFLTPTAQPNLYPQKTPSYPTYSLDDVLIGGKSAGAGAGDRKVRPTTSSKTSATPKESQNREQVLKDFQRQWERQWNRQGQPLGPLDLFSDAARSRSEGEGGKEHSPQPKQDLDVPHVDTRQILNAIRRTGGGEEKQKDKPIVRVTPLPPGEERPPEYKPESCRDQWVPTMNREVKGEFIPVQNRKYKTVYFRNTCNGTQIQVRYAIPQSERAVQKIRSIVRSKANLKRQHQLQHDHGCKCGNNSNFDDSCRCTSGHKVPRSRKQTYRHKHTRRSVNANHRRTLRDTHLPRQKRTYHPKHDTYSRFLGNY